MILHFNPAPTGPIELKPWWPFSSPEITWVVVKISGHIEIMEKKMETTIMGYTGAIQGLIYGYMGGCQNYDPFL